MDVMTMTVMSVFMSMVVVILVIRMLMGMVVVRVMMAVLVAVMVVMKMVSVASQDEDAKAFTTKPRMCPAGSLELEKVARLIDTVAHVWPDRVMLRLTAGVLG